MFAKLKNIWQKWGFEIVLGACLLFILIYALVRMGKKGTWSSSYSYTPSVRSSRRGPPKESKGEIECRRVLEDLFKKPFSKERPDFLRNPVTGNAYNCELDCYNPELNLAVEYNGVQHYKYVPYFHRTKDAFYNQKYRDQWKKRTCNDYGVNLIEVPYTVKVKDIRQYLIRELKSIGYIK